MLALTESAVEAVRGIVSSSDAAPETGGVRMATGASADGEAKLELSVVSLPAEDDEVLEEDGARLFLDPEAAALLDDKVLDARVERDRVAFTIAEQEDQL